MNLSLKNWIGLGILFIGLVAYLLSLISQEIMISVIAMIVSLLAWMIYHSQVEKSKNYKLLGYVLAVSGIILSITVFFYFGVEQVAFPIGAVQFHIEGITKSLIVLFISVLPALIFHYFSPMETVTTNFSQPIDTKPITNETPYNTDEWEEISEEELEHVEFEEI
jgi:hypothetical protein